MKEKVVFILGPTGVGKTEMSVGLAEEFGGEIISADSVQIYRGFDIGSAKVNQEEMRGIKHHCIDILNGNEEFSVAEFVKLTKQKIQDISSKNLLPIIVGGTGLYVKALVEGYDFGKTDKHEEFRQNLERIIEEKGSEFVWTKLYEKHPEIAEKIHFNNKVRLIRGCEIAQFGVKSEKKECDYVFKIFALVRPREDLYHRINSRVDIMIENGLVDEVKSLLSGGIKESSQAMRAIGYKEVLPFLKGEYDNTTMVNLIKQHSRNYAKRQLTFLRGMQDVVYVDTTDFEKAKNEIIKEIKEWI